jgi:hypothetical protein
VTAPTEEDVRLAAELVRGAGSLAAKMRHAGIGDSIETKTSVSDLVTGADQSNRAVALALTYRYLKRIVAHLMNVLSAVVMPVDRLDYFDEDPEDR